MGFLWGASLSSHQVEGNLENDWTRREQRYADEWASQSLFDRLRDYIIGADPPECARNAENYHSGLATDHCNRYKEDIELADSIGLNALRFSIEWSRIEPEQGSIDQNAIDHYRAVIKNLRRRNIEPVVPIWHYAQPQWFVDEYGWHDNEAPEVFSEYVERVVDALGR